MGGILGRQKPQQYDYPGLSEAIGLDQNINRRVGGMLPGLQTDPNYEARWQGILDRGASERFDALNRRSKERNAVLGRRRSSFDKEESAKRRTAEGRVFADNPVYAREAANKDLATRRANLAALLSARTGAGREKFMGQNALNQQASSANAGLFGTLAQIGGGAAAGGLMTPEGENIWKYMAAGGFSPELLRILMQQQGGGGYTLPNAGMM